MNRFDVAVIGAGPAGAIAATLLARRGLAVAMYDPDTRQSARIGESLPAFAAEMLERQALPGPLSGTKHVPITGTISKWGAQHSEDDALMRPGGSDWRLDRAAFDADLRSAARTAGATHIETRADICQNSDSTWTILDSTGTATASWLIDATGRRAAVARRFGGKRHTQPAQVAVWAIGARLTGRATTKILIETQGTGWWYGAVLPSGCPIAAYHCAGKDATQIRRQPRTWHRLYECTDILADKLTPDAFANAQLAFTDATGIATMPPAGRNWIACGDAAVAFDPIASQGLLNAIRTGIAAAETVCGTKTAAQYCTKMQTVWDQYLVHHAHLHARANIKGI